MDYFSLQPRSSPATYFPPHRTQLHPRMHPFSPPSNHNPKKSSSKVLPLLIPLFTVPFLFFLFSIGRELEEAGRVISEMVEFAKWKVLEKERSSTRVVLLVAYAMKDAILVQSSRVIKIFGTVYNFYTQEFEGHTDNPCVSRGYEPPSAHAAKLVESNLAQNLSAYEAEASALQKARNDECLQTSCKNISPKILTTLLKLAEFMGNDEKPLLIDIRLLGALAEKLRAFAKDLHYQEMEFEG
ncbi:hypothetical protein SAY86_000415 [Trapa natans]|uniref:Uncharacterized protein n=1 Tax=Trapa natans TaxID=22666 RepID=A0AAN7MC06_TRANT|nr:hypothetical protein SAY86_000415 [Trapa natans]